MYSGIISVIFPIGYNCKKHAVYWKCITLNNKLVLSLNIWKYFKRRRPSSQCRPVSWIGSWPLRTWHRANMPCQKYTVGAGWPAVGRWATTWGNLGATRRWWGATRWATSRASRGPRGRLKPTRLTSPRKSPGQTGRQVRHLLLPHCCQPLHVSCLPWTISQPCAVALHPTPDSSSPPVPPPRLSSLYNHRFSTASSNR